MYSHATTTRRTVHAQATTSGRVPIAGSRHTATLVGDKLFVLGATDSGTFRDLHVLDIDSLSWQRIEAAGQAPISRSRQTATLVGKNLLIFGGVGGGRPLNDLFVLHAGGEHTFWTEPPANGLTPVARVGHAAALVGTKIFIFGGHDGKSCLNDVHSEPLPTVNDRYRRYRPLPTATPTVTDRYRPLPTVRRTPLHGAARCRTVAGATSSVTAIGTAVTPRRSPRDDELARDGCEGRPSQPTGWLHHERGA